MSMRVTTHSARSVGGRQVGNKHDDRRFDLSKAPHIDPSLSAGNMSLYDAGKWQGASNEETLENFYRDMFSAHLEAQNKRYGAAGQKARKMSLREYMTAKYSCPESELIQVGKVGDTIDPETLAELAREYIRWCSETYPQCQILWANLHVDEPGAAPHVHIRKVWVGHDKDGLPCVSQKKSLDEMGVERLRPDQPVTDRNNSKVTYSMACRSRWIELCREKGLDIEERPRRISRGGLLLDEYKAKRNRETARQAKAETDKAREEARELTARITALQARDAALIRDPEMPAVVCAGDIVEISRSGYDRLCDVVRSARNFQLRAGDLDRRETVISQREEEIRAVEEEAELWGDAAQNTLDVAVEALELLPGQTRREIAAKLGMELGDTRFAWDHETVAMAAGIDVSEVPDLLAYEADKAEIQGDRADDFPGSH